MAEPHRRKRAKARAMYEHGVVGYQKVARELGVRPSTVRRWVNPAYAKRASETSTRAKAKRQGVCIDCGGPTKYNGRQPGNVSRRCQPCQIAFLNSPEKVEARRLWPPEKIIEAIQRWGAEHGETPRTTDFTGRPDYPGLTTVVKKFGTWNNAIEAAGLTPRLPTDRLMAAGERKKGEDH